MEVQAFGKKDEKEKYVMQKRLKLQLQIFFILSVDIRDILVEVSYIHWPKS